MMTEQDIRKRIWREVDKAADQGAVAKKIGVGESYLSEFLHGKRPPNKKLQAYLGLVSETVYRKAANNGR